MAKRKGKSQHRQKDWDRLNRDGEPASDDAETYRRLTQRRIRLPGQEQDSPIFADVDSAAADAAQTTGIIVQLYPGGAIVRTETYGDLMCGLAGTFRPTPGASALAVGDNVTLIVIPETRRIRQTGEKQLNSNRADALIAQRGPRSTALSRPQSMRGKRRDPYDTQVFEKVIAANMYQLVVVAAVAQPTLHRRLFDRYLIAAERGELPMVLVMNKIDLCEPDSALLNDYATLGVQCVSCSVKTGEGLDEVRRVLTQGKRSVLAGASGVGKSSLLNALAPGLNLTTGEVRVRGNRGRHVTSAARLHEMPFGAIVVDTPGIRELGLEIEAAALPWYFPEFKEPAGNCKFRNCTHTHEGRCAVRQAVEAGLLPQRRYASYLRILESLSNS
ncbi:MAG: ribosome small subunit-dependent GTPase A [Planctomycetes bacterium]|nr:ribosome small subunit-dependent GTPase A [Planctomycetota bacterium]